jgi:hypothetical protein
MARPSFDDLDHPGYPEDADQIRVFFDTEFTDFDAARKLISIGFVSEDGRREFYVELTDTWRPEDCRDNPFVRETVLPLLEGGAARMTLAELTGRLGEWIEAFGHRVLLATDSLSWDWPWVEAIFNEPEIWPSNLDRVPLLLTDLQDFGVFTQVVEKAFAAGLRRHHALDDAKANRLGWVAVSATAEHDAGHAEKTDPETTK